MKIYAEKIPWFLAWRGLLGHQPKIVLLHTRFGIHTFGMGYPIDVVILDNKGVVRKLQSVLQPNRLFFWNPIFDTVLELPEGTIKEKHITIGTRIEFDNS